MSENKKKGGLIESFNKVMDKVEEFSSNGKSYSNLDIKYKELGDKYKALQEEMLDNGRKYNLLKDKLVEVEKKLLVSETKLGMLTK